MPISIGALISGPLRGACGRRGANARQTSLPTLRRRAEFAPLSELIYNQGSLLRRDSLFVSSTRDDRWPQSTEEVLSMGVSSGRARVADLAFQVFNRAIHPDWFSTRVYRRITHERWEADVRIIEGGHVVIFGSGSVRLTEILSGPETTLPEPGLVFHSSSRSERSASLFPGAVLEYQTCFEAERVEPDVFRHLCEEMVADGSRHSLIHHFRSSNRLAPPPLSHVHLDPRARGLSIQSFHTFPDECAIVRSQSLYELTPTDSKRSG